MRRRDPRAGDGREKEAFVALASAEMPNMGMRALVDDPDNQTLLIVQTTQQLGTTPVYVPAANDAATRHNPCLRTCSTYLAKSCC